MVRATQRPWLAQISTRGRRTMTLGTWEVERDAAAAYDRAARYYGLPDSALNFPGKDLSPAAPSVLISEARRQGKPTSTPQSFGERMCKWPLTLPFLNWTLT